MSFISNQRRYYTVLFHASFLAFSVSLTVSIFVTNFLKDLIGRPRPDFLDRCKPREGTPTNVFVDSSVCTNTNMYVLKDGFKSLPSGHSSFAFGAFFFLSLWMAGQFGVFSQAPAFASKGNGVKGLICTFPTLIACFIAISRTEDYRHRGSDVIAGTLIGVVFAWLSYRIFFPPLTADDCDTPYVLSTLNAYETAESRDGYEISDDPADIEANIGYHGSLSTTYRNIPEFGNNLNNRNSGVSLPSSSVSQSHLHRMSSKTPLVASQSIPFDSSLYSTPPTGREIAGPRHGQPLTPKNDGLDFPIPSPSSVQGQGSFELQNTPASSNNMLSNHNSS